MLEQANNRGALKSRWWHCHDTRTAGKQERQILIWRRRRAKSRFRTPDLHGRIFADAMQFSWRTSLKNPYMKACWISLEYAYLFTILRTTDTATTFREEGDMAVSASNQGEKVWNDIASGLGCLVCWFAASAWWGALPPARPPQKWRLHFGTRWTRKKRQPC